MNEGRIYLSQTVDEIRAVVQADAEAHAKRMGCAEEAARAYAEYHWQAVKDIEDLGRWPRREETYERWSNS